MKEYMMGGPYDMHGKKDECTQCIGVKTLSKGGSLGRQRCNW